MYQRHRTGIIGESKAVNYLKKNNYNILDRNFKCKQGEIDIVAFDNNTKEYTFVEVKTRTNQKYGKPIEAVNNIKQKHIVLATKYYLYKNKLENKYIRFDVITIYRTKIEHYKNCEFKVKIKRW